MSVSGARREFVAQDLDRLCAGGAGVGSVVILVSRGHPGKLGPPGKDEGGGAAGGWPRVHERGGVVGCWQQNVRMALC